MAGLEARGIRGGILITILGLSLIGWATGLAEFGGIAAAPMASAAFSLDFSMVSSFAFLSVVFVLFFLDFFDTTGTLTGIATSPASAAPTAPSNLTAPLWPIRARPSSAACSAPPA